MGGPGGGGGGGGVAACLPPGPPRPGSSVKQMPLTGDCWAGLWVGHTLDRRVLHYSAPVAAQINPKKRIPA